MHNTALLDAFEAGEIAGIEPHRSHVRVAWELSRRYDPEGLRRLIAGIQGIAGSRGQAGRLYETNTRLAQSRDPG